MTSDPVNGLSWPGEVFYRRLMSVVDDYGRFDGRLEILRAALYPLKLGTVSTPDVSSWIAECERAGLVRTYTVNGRGYIEVAKFDQRLRAKKSKWPPPADYCCQMTADVSSPPQSAAYSESESETGTETEASTRPPSLGPPGDDLETNNHRLRSPNAETPSWGQWWAYCQKKGIAEWYAREKFTACCENNWQQIPNWRARCERVLVWWERDGSPMEPARRNGFSHQTDKTAMLKKLEDEYPTATETRQAELRPMMAKLREK